MLVRLPDDSIRDMPEDIAALLLSDPSHDDDISDFTGHDVNVVIHGVLASYLDADKTFEETLENIRERFRKITPASQEKVRVALDLIRRYNNEIKHHEIGMVSADDMIQFHDPSALTAKK